MYQYKEWWELKFASSVCKRVIRKEPAPQNSTNTNSLLFQAPEKKCPLIHVFMISWLCGLWLRRDRMNADGYLESDEILPSLTRLLAVCDVLSLCRRRSSRLDAMVCLTKPRVEVTWLIGHRSWSSWLARSTFFVTFMISKFVVNLGSSMQQVDRPWSYALSPPGPVKHRRYDPDLRERDSVPQRLVDRLHLLLCSFCYSRRKIRSDLNHIHEIIAPTTWKRWRWQPFLIAEQH